MSKIVKITNCYHSEKIEGNVVYEFIDDLNREYFLEFNKGHIWTYYDYEPEGYKSQVLANEIWSWAKNPLAGFIPDIVVRYIQASFMEWRELVDIENAN